MPKGVYKRKLKRGVRRKIAGAAIKQEDGKLGFIPIQDVKISDLPRLVLQGAMVVTHSYAKVGGEN